MEVLPGLRSNEAIARHFKEYLDRDGTGHPPLPLPIQIALAYRRPNSLMGTLVAEAAKFGCGTMAKQFIAGSTPEEAVSAMLAHRRKGMTFTLDVLGETVIADRVAKEHQEQYLRLIREMSKVAPKWPANPILDEAP